MYSFAHCFSSRIAGIVNIYVWGNLELASKNLTFYWGQYNVDIRHDREPVCPWHNWSFATTTVHRSNCSGALPLVTSFKFKMYD